jgi:hypothetical protein
MLTKFCEKTRERIPFSLNCRTSLRKTWKKHKTGMTMYLLALVRREYGRRKEREKRKKKLWSAS